MVRHTYADRHIGPSADDIADMLQTLGLRDFSELVEKTVPKDIVSQRPLQLPEPMSEAAFLSHMDNLAGENTPNRSFIGAGYYNAIMPSVIRRNILENPGWYTQYTPYQAEISQGRLEALLTFQTMVADLTGLEIANASLLDEATAAAEAMTMCYRLTAKASKGTRRKVAVSDKLFPANIELLKSRAALLGIEVVIGDVRALESLDAFFAVFYQYPDAEGNAADIAASVSAQKAAGVMTVMICDLLALTLLTPPGEFGVDVAVGSTQRFGLPLFYGGPHAAFFATAKANIREVPGRIIGVSKDAANRPVYRMTLQTREQHIKRDKATSNICTAQALPAILAAMYAVYHGAEGLTHIASKMYRQTCALARALQAVGITPLNDNWFDTLTVMPSDRAATLRRMKEKAVNLRMNANGSISVSLDETVDAKTLQDLYYVISARDGAVEVGAEAAPNYPVRKTAFLTHPVFQLYRSETELMRYLKYLENKDLSLTASMIPLGSCTMKLNSAAVMFPVGLPGFSAVHPFAPLEQTKGYAALIENLETYLAEITGFDAVSLQPNSGAQGEYAGLRTILAFYQHTGQSHRNIVLIPESAHGTNPASAAMCGMTVVVIKTKSNGDIDLDDLQQKAAKHADNLAALMVTYPSTYGVFEPDIKTICDTVHRFGGNVYMDGANMNAQVGITSPALIGADVCHLNLHKTFSIPHGGGGPGVGPICVKKHLADFLPTHPFLCEAPKEAGYTVSGAPWGSAGILSITYGYIRMLGAEGCQRSTQVALLNANYIRKRLESAYRVLYTNKNGFNAHELIIDLRPFKAVGIETFDVAKRLIDYSFHAPTVSFPVSGTMMIEPTESEAKCELDRFCEAMLSIRQEIQAIEEGRASQSDNLLKNAPHPITTLTADTWPHPYSREQAAFPLQDLRKKKFWVGVGRVDDTFGDRNIFCSCPPVESA